MRLDHVSYVASHDQISDVVNRIGSQIGTAFVDGGIHPKFGTRNFTAPLLNGQYIEVVCPMDHPATDVTPFGRAVKKKADEGGGWLTWVFHTNSLEEIERRIGRNYVEGRRRKPDGSDLLWKQIGVLATLEKSELPFFIEWISKEHPSLDGKPHASIRSIKLFGDAKNLSEWINGDVRSYLENIQLTIEPINSSEYNYGINSIEFNLYNEKIVSVS
jgi:hypothetical protein